MTELLLIRHAATEWNHQKRLQGRRDIPLSQAGFDALTDRQLPLRFVEAQWFSSPLQRALQTAQHLGITGAQPEPALIEMDWGNWEGKRVQELRAELGQAMEENEARGIDMQPPAGESPRQVMQRFQTWLNDIGRLQASKVGAVTHKGVIRAALSLATGWTMERKFPTRIEWDKALLFELDNAGQLHLTRVNIPLDAGSDG